MTGAGLWCVCGFFLAAIIAACGNPSPKAPTAPGDTVTPLLDLRIVGVPRALSPGATVQLKAEASAPSGGRKECRAAWSSNHPEIASITLDGALTAQHAGYVNITASCTAVTSTVEAKVEAPSPARMGISVRDADWGGVIWEATMEFLDGPRQGETVHFENQTHLNHSVWPLKVRFTAKDYQPLDVVLDEATVTDAFPLSDAVSFWIRMAFAPQADTDTSVGVLKSGNLKAVYPFTPRTAGVIRLRTWWSADNDFTFSWTELWCGGRRVLRQVAPARGEDIVHAIASPAACEVRMISDDASAIVEYRVAITYPH